MGPDGAVQLHYGARPPRPERDDTADPTRRLIEFDDAQQAGTGVLGRATRISVWGRAAGSIDAVACRCDRKHAAADPSTVRFVERAHSCGTRVGRTSRPKHLDLAPGETLVALDGHMGARRILRLRLRTSRGGVLEAGMEKAAAENVGGRPWEARAPLGFGWELVGFSGVLRMHDGLTQLAPIFARQTAADLAEALGPAAPAAPPPELAADSASDGDSDIARFDSSAAETRPGPEAASAASAGIALTRAFAMIGRLAAAPAEGDAGLMAPLTLRKFLGAVGRGAHHPKLAVLRLALEHSSDAAGGGALPASEWLLLLWSAAAGDAAKVQAVAEWLLTAASEADAARGFPAGASGNNPASEERRRQKAHPRWAHARQPLRRAATRELAVGLREGIRAMLTAQAVQQRAAGKPAHTDALRPTARSDPTTLGVEHLTQQLLLLDPRSAGVVDAAELRRCLRRAGLGKDTVDAVLREPVCKRDRDGRVSYRALVRQLL